jgi:hypothetical protein
MKLLAWLRSFIFTFFHRSQVEGEMEEELCLHIRDRADDFERSGLSRADTDDTISASFRFGGSVSVDLAVRFGRALRRISFSRLLATAIPRGNAQHRRGSYSARGDLWFGARLPGLEAGDGNRAVGYSLWRARGLAAQLARQHNRPRLVGHLRRLVAFPIEGSSQ